MDVTNKRYLELLSRSFPTADKASAEIINLSAILNLPKGTEFFASDIHGEYEAFSHTLRNGSGSIRLKIDDVFGDALSAEEKRSLATLIYYPREKTELVLSQVDDAEAWYAVTLPRLVAVCKRAAQKYTRSRVRKALPRDFAYIIEELMTENRHGVDKQAYYAAIIDAVIRTDRAAALVEALCLLIQRLAIERLHIVGDIYDRGPYPHVIMDALMEHHSLDIQWGNHDIVWMGASLGQRGCIAHVVRNCARYGNLSILEDAYGINILPLASFALDAYRDDPCVAFALKGNPDLPPQELEMNVKIQKAMAIIQFKVEGKLIDENPGFGLDDRKLLDKIDYERGTVMLDGVEYELTDTVFPTVDPADPYRLTPEEEDVMQRLEQAFTGCEKLQRHMRFFLDAGSLYKIHNGNLLFHACVPLNADGSLMETDVFGEAYKGRALYDVMERYVRAAFDDADPELAKRGRDLLWYLWLGEGSPLFAKSKMATFELYLIAEKEARKEVKNPFYTYLNDERVMAGIFEDFGMDPETSRIVCGHVPVKVKDGEDPVKCNGRVLTIDGGFSKAYQPTTGIAGYTLISNSYGFVLAAHEPLESMRAAVVNELDIHSSRKVVERVEKRTLVADTDTGAELKQQVADLEQLLEAYRKGEIPEGGK
ncbi:fructose-1,6-bisphosphatase [Eggerthella guodeyinii]|uniref:Fructose-1,6-bisphosphatase n=1 Tax=Eggerthella guodeyinii TaxID=2690837 RepID=A0A6L7ISF8_9ACTN|nr:fructose-1,6-bisphosphatase [Eggerthella guodeyinii]QOS66742.1 fructose-1,6-bisphosphatase [Eggerthella guodeyinii]